MDNSRTLENKVRHYLESLGYPSSAIVTEARLPFDERADLVVIVNGSPLIVVEIKTDVPLPSPVKVDELQFHPYVRELQAFAYHLNSPYYLLTNGSSFLWFTTGGTGRPRIIENPVHYGDILDTISTRLSRNIIAQTFQEVKDLL